ncbi:MBL fold metallo-hydrolase [Sporomusa acidovorans]|uniref:Metallo-hydrolase YycJ n=1 Tax=Sporomusa acidovorans (strain ATCC 49682 / DSM 3132 / Mol) TaxID=1123286 RepID=A0ABZ3J983_SPOA4|nr:MBL fold metallo-hydrolase [Sporomusa acidovorans]OZC22944.1 putative metallo-hydrolase YycJ [Sporomusa acidovorans DSM 3132]SDE94467.1 Phosphoribosyl 1,2-cyclic phosphodiesterase [Sporomusa acidovorans]
MQIHVLASGSTGNAIFVEMENTKLLVDAGISTRRIKQSLAKLGTNIEDLDGVLITHEHRDHVSGLTTLLKKYHLPAYARPDTWQSMYCRHVLPDECCLTLVDSLDIGKVKIEPFGISHDAADPVGFRLYAGSTKVGIATDLGFVTPTVKEALAFSDVLVLESNHDVDMLKNGSYPWPLKKRIMSNRGHLANTDAGWTLARLNRKQHTDVFLAHMSQENNRPELAEKTVADIITQEGCKVNQDITLHLTYPEQISGICKHQ